MTAILSRSLAVALSLQATLFLAATCGQDSSAGERTPLRGTVVDEQGDPVGNMVVRLLTNQEDRKTVTDDKGRWQLPIPSGRLWRMVVIARQDDDRNIGYARLDADRLASDETNAGGTGGDSTADPFGPITLQLGPARIIRGIVRNAQSEPLPNVFVAAVSTFVKVAETQSNADGEFELLVPAEASMTSVCAFHRDHGLDYFLYRQPDAPKDNPFTLDAKHDSPLELILEGILQIKVHVQDEERQPLAGVDVTPWYFEKPRKGGSLNSGLDEFKSVTDEAGDATIYAPENLAKALTIWTRTPHYHAPERTIHRPGDSGEDGILKYNVVLEKMVTLRGTVLDTEGVPQPRVTVYVRGANYSYDSFRSETQTDESGHYEMEVYPNHFYQIVAIDDHLASPARTVVIRREQVTTVDFELSPATRVHGRLTMGQSKRPVADQSLQLYHRTDAYYKLPEDKRLPNPQESRRAIAPYIVRTTKTNEQGEFEFVAGPGDYYIIGPRSAERPEFQIAAGAAEHVANLHASGPERIATRGAVVVRGNAQQRVAEAKVQGVSRETGKLRLYATTDEDGKFAAQRGYAPMRVFARSADGALAGFVNIQADDPFVLIPVAPTATASCTLVDAFNKPVANRRIDYGIRFDYDDETFSWLFGGNITTDAEGRFQMECLVVGEEYEIHVATRLDGDGNATSWRSAGSVKAAAPGPFDAGYFKFTPRK